MRKPHEWVLFQVNKTHKTNCPSNKTNSKRKTLNGCCQICIKTVKMTQKCEKSQGGRPWKLWERKWRFWREVEDDGAAELSHADLISWSYHPCHLYLQNCHSATHPLRFTKMPLWASNVDPLTLLTWKWYGNDVAMMWKVSSTKY